MTRRAALILLLAGCSKPADDASDTDTDVVDTDDTDVVDTDVVDTDTDAPAGPRLTVITIDPDGAPLPVQRVAWHDVADFAVPLRPLLDELACAEGSPPCATWVLDEADLPDRVHVLAELEQPDRTWEGDDTGVGCFYWASQHTIVQLPDDAGPQVVHLVLDPDALWCESLLEAGPVPPFSAPTVHPDDVRVDPPEPAGPTAVVARDAAGDPLLLLSAVWYHPPEDPSYDGEHPLACADALCTTWVLTGSPAGPIYVAATYAGPYHPIQGAAWTDFQASPVDDVASLPVTLTFDTLAAQIQ